MKYIAIAMLLVICGGCSLTTSKRVPRSSYHLTPLYDNNDRLNYGGAY